MFRSVPLFIISFFSFYCTQQDQDGTGSTLILLASCQQTCVTYTVAVCRVQNSWWWTEELPETCRVLFQKQIWEISASSWFCYKNLSRCTVTWTSNTQHITHIIQNNIQHSRQRSIRKITKKNEEYILYPIKTQKRVEPELDESVLKTTRFTSQWVKHTIQYPITHISPRPTHHSTSLLLYTLHFSHDSTT